MWALSPMSPDGLVRVANFLYTLSPDVLVRVTHHKYDNVGALSPVGLVRVTPL